MNEKKWMCGNCFEMNPIDYTECWGCGSEDAVACPHCQEVLFFEIVE